MFKKMICVATSACLLLTGIVVLSACDMGGHTHTAVEDAAVSATCTKSGLSAGSHCSACGEVIKAQTVIPAKGHTPVKMAGREATCTESGLSEGSYCSACSEILQEQVTLQPTGHKFGTWVIEEDRQYRTCSVCSYKEMQYDNDGETGEEGGTVYGSYTDFTQFKSDCAESGKTLTYQGNSNSFEVNLSGTTSCNDYTIVIPSRVVSVRFIGETKGNPYENLQIKIADRKTDFSISFENVRIESNRTILVSETRYIVFDMYILGEECSFIITAKGATGTNGKNASGFSDGGNGGRGEDGSDAMIINGDCTITTSAKLLKIQGGDGGDGGNGGKDNGLGHSGYGGAGGNGGKAVSGEFLATVIKTGEDCRVFVSGGKGGQGGSGRSSGAKGTDSSSGCAGDLD